MSDKVKSRLMIAGAALCTALFLFSGAMLAREYLDQKQSAEAFDEVAGLVKEDVELPTSRRISFISSIIWDSFSSMPSI